MLSISGHLGCPSVKFSAQSLDFVLEPENRPVTKFDALEKKKMFFMFDATNHHDRFDNKISIRAQERGERPDYMNFHSRPISLHLGYYHAVEVHVSRFTETERYKKLADDQKECISKEGKGSKR